MILKLNRVSFGGTAAIVSSMALIVGLSTADASRQTIIAALLIAALADNLTDSLSVHIYQESEIMPEREALFGTLTNFATRLGISMSFVLLIALLPMTIAIVAELTWGAFLLSSLTYLIARERKANPYIEVAKHLVVAFVIIAASKGIGYWLVK